MTAEAALEYVRVIVTLAVLHQSIESLLLRRADTWPWSEVRRDFATWPAPARVLLDILGRRPVAVDTAVALGAAASLAWESAAPWLLPLLWLGITVASLRTRGAVGGASDCMTFQVLGAVCLASLFGGEFAAHVALLAIAVQSVLSYFLAGLVKIKNPRWRSGLALGKFVGDLAPSRHRGWTRSPGFAIAASWGVMAFELGFPAALFHWPVTVGLLVCGALFHAINAHVLGLHRFVLPWLATYPAVAYLALWAT